MKTITINGEEYSGILKTKTCVELERSLGENPLNILAKSFTAMGDGKLPDIEDLVILLSGCLKTNHPDLTEDDVCDLIDEYCKTNPDNLPAFPLLGILDFISEVFVDSGFVLANSPKEKKKGKNK